ncbi:MAG: hypothetical protein IJT94_09550 [Oscillibacter sp.]|nr:hypothetical protein [Oscillibacter sp.]
MNGRREYGDYQTPPEFSRKVCLYLKNHRNLHPTAVVEPTCGVGSFLQSSLLFDAGEYYGIEINPEYCEICRNTIQDGRVNIINADFFSFSSRSLIHDSSRVLVIGNPPWVTNSFLSSSGAKNLPEKKNFKGLRGIDAMTGESNFDICEYMILRLIQEYSGSDTVIAMLCKTSVARNVFIELKRTHTNTAFFDLLEFDAAKVFGVSASACVLLIQLSRQKASTEVCNVYELENPDAVKERFGFSCGKFYHSLDASAVSFDGVCPLTWRQGVKHDCSAVMELTQRDGALRNGRNEAVEIEPEYIFPLVKSSLFKQPVIHSFSKYVIVTQRTVREDTAHIARDAPKTWDYLDRNRTYFTRRKSTIYRDAPPFSMFGIGPYSFARYKVGVSGFYKRPMFSVLYADDGKSVMTDDTSYFLCFDSFDTAYAAMLLLNSAPVQDFLAGIAFLDAKRPYTKKILSRIDLGKAVNSVPLSSLKETERTLCLPDYMSDSIYNALKSLFEENQMSFY